MSDNAELAELIDRYQLAVFMTLLRQAVGAEQMIRDSIEQHEAIAAAILAGDPDQAYAAMRHHLCHSANGILERDALKSANALRSREASPGNSRRPPGQNGRRYPGPMRMALMADQPACSLSKQLPPTSNPPNT